jgi:DNA-directed RNA polymerase|tara:strand:- start:5720 stop:6631 length:912 start_codon:yes stop_codon:yes gene_type:complete
MQKFEIGSKVKEVPKGYERVEAQKELEQKMLIKGKENFYKNINKAKALKKEVKGKDGQIVIKDREPTESTTIYGQQLLQEAINPVSVQVHNYYNECTNGHSKKYAKASTLLSQCIHINKLESEDYQKWSAVSLIALKVLLDSITQGSTQTKASIKIANSLEDEARLKYFQENDSKTYSKTRQWLKKKNNYRHKRKIYVYAMGKHELEYGEWPKIDKVQLGLTLIDLVIKATGFVRLQRRVEGRLNTPIYVEATEKTMEWIKLKKFHSEILKPMRKPMITKVRKWTNPYDGGYLTHSYKIKEIK